MVTQKYQPPAFSLSCPPLFADLHGLSSQPQIAIERRGKYLEPGWKTKRKAIGIEQVDQQSPVSHRLVRQCHSHFYVSAASLESGGVLQSHWSTQPAAVPFERTASHQHSPMAMAQHQEHYCCNRNVSL